MKHLNRVKHMTLHGLLLMPCFFVMSGTALSQMRDMGCSPTLANPCTGGSGSSGGGGYSAPSYDYEAERRQQEEQAAEAERVRQEEVRRQEAEDRRRKEEAEKQAAFIRSRDEAARSLKGSSFSGGLKGSSQLELKDAMRELKGSSQVSPDKSKQVVAWKQLHCAASIAGYALSALQTRGDYKEFGTLSTEALKALDGQRLNVECRSAPPFPDLRGKPVDLDRIKDAERNILTRAAAIADRAKQRGDTPQALTPPTTAQAETQEEKLRRVQRELNAINSQKVTGKTQQQINQQEKDRQDLAQLVLINNGIEKGNLTNVSVDLEDDPKDTNSGSSRR